jgi:hypothetical protein
VDRPHLRRSIEVSQKGARRVRDHTLKDLFGFQAWSPQRKETISRVPRPGRCHEFNRDRWLLKSGSLSREEFDRLTAGLRAESLAIPSGGANAHSCQSARTHTSATVRRCAGIGVTYAEPTRRLTGSPALRQAWKPPSTSVAQAKPSCCSVAAARLDW